MASRPSLSLQKPLPPAGDGVPASRPAPRSAQLSHEMLQPLPGGTELFGRNLENGRPSSNARGRGRLQGSALNIAVPPNLAMDDQVDPVFAGAHDRWASARGAARGKPTMSFPDPPIRPGAPGELEEATAGGRRSPLDLTTLPDAPPPPMPARPRPGRPSSEPKNSKAAGITRTKDTMMKPYVPEAPPAAPRLAGDGTLMGHDPDTIIRTSY